MIIAVAGRRIDAAGTRPSRFPLENLALVKERVRTMLQNEGATAVVCGAAGGADLITLAEAGELHLKRRIVLSSPRERFRETSVIDRPGNWGPLYDRILDEVEAAGELVVLQGMPRKGAYSLANLGILDEAAALAAQLHEPVEAALVWDGLFSREHDVTGEFGDEARKRGWAVLEISTLANSG